MKANDVDSKKNFFTILSSYYELDKNEYAEFMYYDADNDRIVYDNWNTAMFCSSYSTYVKPSVFSSKYSKKFIPTWKRHFNNVFDKYTLEFDCPKRYNVPCSVSEGRKFKGYGILKAIYEKKFYKHGLCFKSYNAIIDSEGTYYEATSMYVDIDYKTYRHTLQNIFLNLTNEEVTKLIKDSNYDDIKNDIIDICMKKTLD